MRSVHGVPETSLRRKMKLASDVRQMANHTTQESKAIRSKPTDEERQEWWRLHAEEGLTANAIHKKTGRNRETVTKEIKRRKSGESKPEATERPPVDDQPVTPTGKLNEHMKILVKREGKSSKQRIELADRLGQVKEIVQKTMEAASKDHRRGPGVVRGNVQAAERQLAKDGQPGIQESLERVRKEARDIWKYADESLRLLQLQDSFTELK